MATDHTSRRAMVELAERNGGALTRTQARDCGVSRNTLVREHKRGRVVITGRAVRVVGAPITRRAEWIQALADSSPRAALDGLTALEFAGLEHFADSLVHIGLPKGARAAEQPNVVVHHQRHWTPQDVVAAAGVRVVVPAVAAIRSALWLPTARASATVLAMTVQQHLATVEQLADAASFLPRRRRARDIRATIDELRGGAESINELDLALGCRRRGIPEPDRQVRRRTPSGLWILDVRWSAFGVAAEVNGVHHQRPYQAYRDDLKQNESSILSDCTLRIPSYAVRDDEDVIYDQIRRALRSRGWLG